MQASDVADRLLQILPDLENVGLVCRNAGPGENGFSGYRWTAQEVPGDADEKMKSGFAGGDRWKVFRLILAGQTQEPRELDQIFDGSRTWMIKSLEIPFKRNLFRVRALYGSTPAAFSIANSSPLPAGTHGVPYSVQLTTAGGMDSLVTNAADVWTLTTGALPTGLALNSAGLLAGTPAQAGSYTFTVQVADGFGFPPVSKAFSLVIG